MDTPITIEYGDKLRESGTIHQGMLLTRSTKLQGLYAKAQIL